MSELEKIAAQIAAKSNPPVHLWAPDSVGTIDIRVDAQGHWFHEGTPIARLELVKLFASILWFEPDHYFLVTPVEKLSIEVADVPFTIEQLEQVDNAWVATTNLGQQLIVSEDHPVELREYHGQLIPYIKVRYELWARLSRSTFYHWVTTALEQTVESAESGENPGLYLHSGSYQFALS